MTVLIFSHIYAVGAGATFAHLVSQRDNENTWEHLFANCIVAIFWPLCCIAGVIVSIVIVFRFISRLRNK